MIYRFLKTKANCVQKRKKTSEKGILKNNYCRMNVIFEVSTARASQLL